MMRAVPVRMLARASLVLTLSASAVRADDGRLRLMHEPVPYTDVIDAFDAHDRFDLNVHLDYTRMREHAFLYRERTGATGTRQDKVAESHLDTNLLNIGVEVGLFRDLMGFVRMPLVLRDSRSLEAAGVGSAALTDEDGTQALFSLPFESPARAGLDYIAFGGAYSLLNQARTPWTPTWMVRVEGRRALGKLLHPCVQGSPHNVCGNQSTEDRDGDGVLDGTRASGVGAGVSRGLSALQLETRFSRRFRYAEPYAGLGLLLQWPSTARTTFRPEGEGRAHPGPEGTATLGVAVMVLEDRGTFQRAMLDLRLNATHVSRGTNYSPLFDALGTSSDASLAGGFYGLTEAEEHLRYGGQVGVELQAARYVRFAAGTTLQWVTDHALTGMAPCTGSGSGASDDGRTCSGSHPDKREHAVLDAPGNRFFIRDQFLLGVYAQATAMF